MMSVLWLGDVGIRVTSLEGSLEFYTTVPGLREIDRGGDEDGRNALLKDPHSGHRLELNWYADTNPFAAQCAPGEALEVEPATRRLWANRKAVEALAKDPHPAAVMGQDVQTSGKGHRIVYIQDQDGNFLCVYDDPEEPWGGPVPDHY